MGRAEYLLKLLDARLIQRFPLTYRKWLILYDKFGRDIQKHTFFFMKQYIEVQKYPMRGAYKVLVKSLKLPLMKIFLW